MALYRFSAGVVARGRGHSSTAAAAYRAGERITDERTGQTFDYSRRTGVLWTGIYAPKDAPEWMQNRATLWNAVEQGEKRKDARTAREFVVCLPHELNLEQGRRLLGDFVREQFARKGFVVDAAIHAPGKGGDDRNIHAHFLVTTRQVQGGRFVEKKDRTQNEKATLESWREAWAKLGNRHLERAGHAGNLDHRNYEDQGIDRTPGYHKGKTAQSMERRGIPTDKAERASDAASRRKEIAEIKAELARLEATPPANDRGRPEDRPANDNAADRKPEAVPPILKANPLPVPGPAEPLSVSPAFVRPPVTPPQPAQRERVEIRPPAAATQAPPTPVDRSAEAEVSPLTSTAAERKLDTSTAERPKVQDKAAKQKPKTEREPTRQGIRALFTAVADLTRSLLGKGRDAQDCKPAVDPATTLAAPTPEKPAVLPPKSKPPLRVTASIHVPTQAGPPLPPTATPPAKPKPPRLTPAQLRAELEEQRVRRERGKGGPDL